VLEENSKRDWTNGSDRYGNDLLHRFWYPFIDRASQGIPGRYKVLADTYNQMD
jgi:hypothetical protein